MNYLLVFSGGGVGSILRYAIGLCIGAAAFPWATLAVNKESLVLAQSGRLGAFSAYALGSIAIGLIAVALGYLIAKQ